MSMTTTDNRIARIEDKINPEIAGAIGVSRKAGGLALTNMRDIMEFAKVMSTAKNAVPKHCQGEPGVCLAICVQAFEWGMSPFAVANQSYSAKEGQPLGYMSQLIHAVVESRAPLLRRLRSIYEGEGVDRRITVIGMLKGEDEPCEYTSPAIKDIKVKNSPLWVADPDQQLWYYGTRMWARKWVPDVLMGIYTPDEIETMPIPEHMQDITPIPNLAERLANRQGPATEGFPPADVDILAQMTGEVIEQPQDAPESRLGAPIVGPLVPEPPKPEPPPAAKPASRRGRKAKPLSADAPSEDPIPPEYRDRTPEEEARFDVWARLDLKAKDENPDTPAEYFHWLAYWLPLASSAPQVFDRWSCMAEKAIRNHCFLSSEQVQQALRKRDDRIQELSGEEDPPK